ncbi:hypothetical protein AURDEDRAFT_166368 [Auricularia subglabra TFB-10046 SS5]|uniref:Uncharacterized protein n=1 Tax=Auricularia subglabra (strain TFB-10046 / SS5) TaxID=717982 RepID=J0LKP2_AURST|nr:hypothetical protein AURDEDRAFT_166368 [Auricularia subglabra TFB-10046 SS5]
MKTASLALTLSTLFVASSASVLTARQGNNVNQPTCGTTADATLSDCQYLFDHWPNFADWGPTCHYSLVHKAWRPACYGNCCIYTDWDGGLWEDIKLAVDHLLDCGDPGKDSVNGVVEIVDSGRVCLSDGTGCGDCFED